VLLSHDGFSVRLSRVKHLIVEPALLSVPQKKAGANPVLRRISAVAESGSPRAGSTSAPVPERRPAGPVEPRGTLSPSGRAVGRELWFSTSPEPDSLAPSPSAVERTSSSSRCILFHPNAFQGDWGELDHNQRSRSLKKQHLATK
jgi:hypothetical protein